MLLCALLLIVTIILLNSRGVWLGTAVLLAVLVLWASVRKTRRWQRDLQFIALALIAAMAIGGTYLFSVKAFPSLMEMRQAAVESRIEMYNFVFTGLVPRHLLSGIGYTSFQDLFTYEGQHLSLHNTFLIPLVASGLFGFCSFLLLVLVSATMLYHMTVFRVRGSTRQLAFALGVSLVASVTVSQFYSGYASKPFWFLLGLVNSLYKIYVMRRRRVAGVRRAYP